MTGPPDEHVSIQIIGGLAKALITNKPGKGVETKLVTKIRTKKMQSSFRDVIKGERRRRHKCIPKTQQRVRETGQV